MGWELINQNQLDYDQVYQHGGYYFRGTPFQRGYNSVYFQNGDGVGGIFRFLSKKGGPVLKKLGKVVGKEALQTTANILDNIAQGGELKEVIKEEAKKGIKRLASKVSQSGGAAKRRRVAKPAKKKAAKKKPAKKKPTRKPKRIIKVTKRRLPAFFKPRTKLGFY